MLKNQHVSMANDLDYQIEYKKKSIIDARSKQKNENQVKIIISINKQSVCKLWLNLIVIDQC